MLEMNDLDAAEAKGYCTRLMMNECRILELWTQAEEQKKALQNSTTDVPYVVVMTTVEEEVVKQQNHAMVVSRNPIPTKEVVEIRNDHIEVDS